MSLLGRRRFALRALLLILAALASSWAHGVGAGGEESISRYRSPMHVCVTRDGSRAFVADYTADTVSVLDVAGRRVVKEIPTGPRPVHLTLAPDERTLYVSCLHGQRVQVVDVGEGRVTRELTTGYEPYGTTLVDSGRQLVVVNSVSGTVSFLDAATGRVLGEVPVGQEPRHVAQAGQRLVVTHSISRFVSIIDIPTRRLVENRPLGQASLQRQVVCTPDGRWAFVAHLVARNDVVPVQMERGWIHSNGFSVLDLQKPGHYVTLLLDQVLDGAPNPWGMALSPDGKRLYVTVAGAREVALVDVDRVLEVVRATRPDQVVSLGRDVDLMRRLDIGKRVPSGGIGPRGVALCAPRGELLVANYFSDSVAALDARSGEVRARIPLGPHQPMTPERRGEMLFNDGTCCYQRWFTCASCHQEDATSDGLNWDLPNDGYDNPKNNKSLHDIHDTPPAMWTGARENLEEAVEAGLRFQGLVPDGPHREFTVALVAFLNHPPLAPNPYRNLHPEAIRRGQEIFNRSGCPECHPPPLFTDLKRHDAVPGTPNDPFTDFDTPTLRECYRTAPYLHDGRAETLQSVFRDHNKRDEHGVTSRLSDRELDDLIEYLRSL